MQLLDHLVTSKTRIKLLLKFFVNPESSSYLRSLAEEFEESTNAVRVELNRLTQAGLLTSDKGSKTRLFKANTKSPLFHDLHKLVKQYVGLDKVEDIVSKLGKVENAFIIGDYAKGKDTGIIDLVLIGDINKSYLNELIEVTENLINRKIRPLVLTNDEFLNFNRTIKFEKALILWNNYNEK